MKKNLLSILILALLVVNIVLTAIMMFSVTGAMKSTTSLVTKIATVLDLELQVDTMEAEVPVENLVPYDLGESTYMLKVGEDGEQHYAMVTISIQMNSKNKDYETYSKSLTENDALVKDEVINVFRAHTLEEFNTDPDGIRSEILTRLRKLYNSDFIYRVAFGDMKAQ